MKEGFVAEILRAAGTLRSGDPAGVTDIIRASLAAGGLARQGAAAAAVGPQATAERTSGPKAGEDQPPPQRKRSARPRKSLGETVRILSNGRPALRHGRKLGARTPAAIPVPEGAAFRDLHYSCAAGARRYRLYVPASGADGLQGLVVMLHGCTQSPEDFAAGTGMNALAEENRLLVIYPAQTSQDNAMACWNWFRPGDQMRDAGEPAIIAGLTESVRAEFEIPGDRIFVAGLSAGGAMAAIMGETYPKLYAAIGVHSGLAYGSAHDVVSAFGAMKGEGHVGDQITRCGTADENAPRVIVFHGSADRTVHPENARRIIARQGADPSRIRRTDHAPADGRHRYSRLVLPGADGTPLLECWMIEGADHAWSGGHPNGSYTDPRGPSASAEMVRFFLAEPGEG